jgi:type I restriction-modification system DNA methylase subunit
LKNFLEKFYDDAKNDIATAFLERCLDFLLKGGSIGLVLPQNWLFLTTYKMLREKLLRKYQWNLLARLGPGAFETVTGEVVKAILIIICSVVLMHRNLKELRIKLFS